MTRSRNARPSSTASSLVWNPAGGLAAIALVNRSFADRAAVSRRDRAAARRFPGQGDEPWVAAVAPRSAPSDVVTVGGVLSMTVTVPSQLTQVNRLYASPRSRKSSRKSPIAWS